MMPLIKTAEQQRLEARLEQALDAYMLEWWEGQLRAGNPPSVQDLADHLEVHPNTVRAWWDAYGLALAWQLRRVG